VLSVCGPGCRRVESGKALAEGKLSEVHI